MSDTTERKALLGILPKCGHACAIDADTSQEARMQMAGYGYDILTLPMEEAVQRFDRGWGGHMRECEKGGDR